MARTSNVFAHVEPEIKEQVEKVLEKLGIPMSNAVGMFLRQVVLQQGILFELTLPTPNNSFYSIPSVNHIFAQTVKSPYYCFDALHG